MKDFINVLKSAEFVRLSAKKGTLPNDLSIADLARLWADSSGQSLQQTMTDLTRAVFSGRLSVGEHRSRQTGGTGWMVVREHFAQYLAREKQPLPSFWFKPDEIERHAEEIRRLAEAELALTSRQKSMRNLKRPSDSVTDDEIRAALAENTTREAQAKRLGWTVRHLQRELKERGIT